MDRVEKVARAEDVAVSIVSAAFDVVEAMIDERNKGLGADNSIRSRVLQINATQAVLAYGDTVASGADKLAEALEDCISVISGGISGTNQIDGVLREARTALAEWRGEG